MNMGICNVKSPRRTTTLSMLEHSMFTDTDIPTKKSVYNKGASFDLLTMDILPVDFIELGTHFHDDVDDNSTL